MIAVDTSSLSAFLKGDGGADIDRLATALRGGQLCLPPVVLTEILSDPSLGPQLVAILGALETLPILDGYWRRAGLQRQELKRLHLRSKVADALIAQSCIDHDVPLITRDSDFRHFVKHCGLKLA